MLDLGRIPVKTENVQKRSFYCWTLYNPEPQQIFDLAVGEGESYSREADGT